MLEVRNLWFRYPNSSWILKSLNLDVYEGETLLVIGRSGCGKTTLIRAIMGVGASIYGGEVRGRIVLDGREIGEYSIEELRRVIQIVNQDPRTHFIYPNIYEDLYTYALQIHRDEDRAGRALDEVSESLKIKHLLDRLYFEISGGELRRVVIAKALLSKPKILLFDEPLMWLDDAGVRDFLDALAKLKSSGVTVIVFEHRFAPLVNHINRVLKFANGSLEHVSLEVLRKVWSTQPYRGVSIGSVSSERVVEIDGLWYSYGGTHILKNVSMTVNSGDSVAIYGANGSGKTTLLKIIAGYLKPQKGYVKRFGRAIYIPQIVTLFFTEESIELELSSICKSGGNLKKCYSTGMSILKSYGFEDLTLTPFNLSWGQQEKLAVTLALAAGFNIFLLDEPFSGLTYTDRIALAEYLTSVSGAKIVTISSSDSLPLLKGFKVYRLSGGVLEEYRPTTEIQQNLDYNILTSLYSD